MERKKGKQIRQFILEEVRNHPKDIVHTTEKTFGVTRKAVYFHVNKLIDSGLLIGEGNTRNRQYKLKPIADKKQYFSISKNLKEDVLWRVDFRPDLANIPQNVLDICNYGFTEMVNNVIDHSAGTLVMIRLVQTAVDIEIDIFDNGIGIFKKIQMELGLEDQRHSILELSKGKLTTDPIHHTGEGIFFSSRMFDTFNMGSGGIYFIHSDLNGDWLIGDAEETEGTLVKMNIRINSAKTAKEVFDKYSSENEYDFSKTIVPVLLAKYGDENLVSRSQAKRLLVRFEKFREVVLNFSGVENIGQAFADEIFRVFRHQNPQVHITFTNANKEVKRSIMRAMQNDFLSAVGKALADEKSN